jgi:DNA-binding response OmpR family regulator
MHILVVEDDRSVRETLGLVLESYDYSADLVEDAEGAMSYLASKWPDVLLLDLTLQGMSGEELYNRILQKFGRVPPTVVLSADQYGATRTRSMPGARFLAKPYTIEQLTDLLSEAARDSSLGAA